MSSLSFWMAMLQVLLLAPKVVSLSAIADESHSRLLRHESQEAMMDSHGRMQVKPHRKSQAETGMLKKMFPFYHTSDEIRSEAHRLSKKCGGKLNITTLKDSDVSIDAVTIRKPGAKPPNKVFILFGEHSRELISPESGLHFMRALCGDVKLDGHEKVEDVLEDAEFQIVLNGNPRSRKKVEHGDFCLRTNPSGVDLNRNWDEHYEKEAAAFGSSSNPGPKPFSEPETRIFKRLVTDYAPTTFLTVHSGTRGMYMPWAYDMKHLANYNEPQMMDILRALDSDHCKCPFGAAGKEVGYPCPGTCLDYAYGKLKTPFAYAFEIYTSADSDEELKERWEEKMHGGGAELIQQGNHLAHPHFRDLFLDHSSDFVQIDSSKSGLRVKGKHSSGVGKQAQSRDSPDGDSPDMSCFDIFNPSSKDDYDKVVANWASAYMQMSSLVAQSIRAGKVPKATMPVE